MSPFLSVVIITFNEELNIERAIKSVLKIADEIIIVDSFSTDNTKQICNNYNVQFIERKWQGYSNTKNFANSLVKFDYILSLDADESVSKKLENSILKEKKRGFNGIYKCNRLTNYLGKWIKYGGWYPDTKIRIFPKNHSKWEGEFVHEKLIFDKKINEKILTGDLHHYSYYSYKDHKNRADKYSILTAQKLYNKGKKASIIKPYLSSMARFFSMYFLKFGFLDGYKGFKIAFISAQSNVLKYKELRRLNKK